jgi:hypothetical protein
VSPQPFSDHTILAFRLHVSEKFVLMYMTEDDLLARISGQVFVNKRRQIRYYDLLRRDTV